jgi:hypothetical protein
MYGKLKVLLGLSLIAVAPSAFAQYTLDLTGVGNGTVADGVYVSPYQGTISTGGSVIYSGYMICDDFNTESYLNTPWNASMTNAGALNGTEKFPGSETFDGTTYSAQQAYNAAGWLANQLLNNPTGPNQVNYSFAIWNILDGQQVDPSGGALLAESAAFSEVNGGYVASNVSVYTPALPTPINGSQEFLVVSPMRAPEIDPASAASGLTLLLGGLAVARGRRAKKAA